MKEFLEFLVQGSTGLIATSYRRPQEDGKDKWINQFHSTDQLDKIVAEATSADAKGWDCYVVPAVLRTKSRRKYAFKESNVAWIDYDGDAPLEFKVEPSAVVESSPGHFHAYWRVDEPMTSSQTELTNQALAELHGADSSGWDCTQLLRLPGTTSKKRDCPVVLTQLTEKSYGVYELPKTWSLHLHV